MKILLFTLEYPPFQGGIANYYGNMLKYWPDRYEIFVLNNNKGELISNILPFFKWIPSIFKLKKSIKDNKIDYILVGHILPLGTAAYILSYFLKFKFAVIMHGMDYSFSQKSKRKMRLTEKILKRSDKIICSNSYLMNEVKKDYGNKVFLFNPGIVATVGSRQKLLDELKEKYNLENKFLLLTVGRLVERKGFAKVINLIPELVKTIPNLVYIIVGNGPERDKLSGQIKFLNLKNVITINDADDEARNAWLNLSDVFIMISEDIKGDYEGFGIVYLEANLAGKPVIAGDSGGVRDAVVNDETGLLIDPDNKEAIIKAIQKLYKDKDLREKMGHNGKTRALNEFVWSKHINELYKILNK
jgi:phosphatidylinositol alpha-1,6-mannosyltransferase